MSFQDLKKSLGCKIKIFFRYLQLRDFLNKKLKNSQLSTGNELIINILENAYRGGRYQKIISKLYCSLISLRGQDTRYVKARWETESNLFLTGEEWDGICRQQWSVTSSPSWREFSWKNVFRYFITPAQKSNYSHNTTCWRHCGHARANHFHIFWECPRVVPFWKEIHKVMETIFQKKIQFHFALLYLGNLESLNL